MIGSLVVTMTLASCVDPLEGCLCEPTAWVRLGTVVETDAGLAVIDGTALGFQAPDAAFVTGHDAGVLALAVPNGSLAVDENGYVTCGYAGQLRLRATDYAQALFDQNCRAALVDAGHDPNWRCNDVRCRCSSGPGAALGALLLVMRRRRC